MLSLLFTALSGKISEQCFGNKDYITQAKHVVLAAIPVFGRLKQDAPDI